MQFLVMMKNTVLNIEEVTRVDFEAESKAVGLGSKVAMRIYDEVAEGLKAALNESAEDLRKLGFKEANKIAGKIYDYCCLK